MSAPTFPPIGPDGALLKSPVRIVDRRLVKHGNLIAVEILVEWANTFSEDAFWEKLLDFQCRYPTFDP